jgi:hypothetical protein
MLPASITFASQSVSTGCRNEMRLASIDPTDEKAVYTYECANGQQRKISTADPTSIRGMPTVQPIAGSAPPEPWEIFSAVRNTSLPPSTVAERTGPQFICGVCCSPGRKRPLRRGLWKSGGQAPPRRTTRRWRIIGYGGHTFGVGKHSEDAVNAHVEEHGKKWRAVIIK